MEFFVFPLVARRECRTGCKYAAFAQNGPFAVHEPNVRIGRHKRLDFWFYPFAIWAIVVKKFDDSDIAIDVAENRRIGITL